ncbi:MAG: hypothetical protein P8Y36_06025, partial [Alphaproteobacteria bacterium]
MKRLWGGIFGVVILALSSGSVVAQQGGDPVLRITPLERDRVSPNHPAKNLPLQTEAGKAD